MALEISSEIKNRMEKLVGRYPTKEAAIIPIIHLIRRNNIELSDEAIKYVASFLDVTPVQVEGVVSFYPMFQPKKFGKNIIQVCSTLSCSMMGSKHIVEYLQKKLNVKVGETTEDKKFTLLKSECLASCGTAPVMQINELYYEDLTEEKIDTILGGLD